MSRDIFIKKSNLHGRGVFANRDFKKGEIVLSWHPKKITKKQVNELSDKGKEYVLFEDNKYYLMQKPERYINHSCDSNTVPKNNCDVAICKIGKGEEITSDYSKIESLDDFKCKCESKNCKLNLKCF